ncbi:unnamed protein product [Larinioides sclopetarius]|uniref:Uncharacterized protein n=1 Tax=Larinioides sclopetarius TaxID=280406 RepID=A0AAV1ZLE4_9ARAC
MYNVDLIKSKSSKFVFFSVVFIRTDFSSNTIGITHLNSDCDLRRKPELNEMLLAAMETTTGYQEKNA